MSKRWKDSLQLAFGFVGGMATIASFLGFSLKDPLRFDEMHWLPAMLIRMLVVCGVYMVAVVGIWIYKGIRYNKEVKLQIGKNKVKIKTGDIFAQQALRVIAVDTHFTAEVDDRKVARSSLHGQVALKDRDGTAIRMAVKQEAERREIQPDSEGNYQFPLGTVIQVEIDSYHYALVALTEMDDNMKSHTSFAQYEQSLMTMWQEMNLSYMGRKIALPILGNGLTRFDDYQDDPKALVRCMLCTLNTSRVHFCDEITIVVRDHDDFPLYEFKDLAITLGQK